MKPDWLRLLLGFFGASREEREHAGSYYEDSAAARLKRLSLQANGQSRPVEVIESDELLYRGVFPDAELFEDTWLALDSWGAFDDGGVSVNRSRHSIPIDLRHTLDNPQVGWAEARASDFPIEREVEIPAMTAPSGAITTMRKPEGVGHFATAGTHKIGLKAVHEPVAASSDGRHNYPENYAHSALRIQFYALDLDSVPEYILLAMEHQGDRIRQALSSAFRVTQLPVRA